MGPVSREELVSMGVQRLAGQVLVSTALPSRPL